MITDISVEISAPAPTVWDVFVDVERWPQWTASVERLAALDGPGLEVGRRVEIKQPKMAKLVLEGTDVVPGASWTWRQRSPGATTFASHELEVLDTGRTLVRQRIDQRGPLGAATGVLMRRMTRRYLDLEGQGLKACSEQRHRDAPTA